MVRVRKEMGFHARFKAVIKLAVFSKTILHFDAVIVCCMIYDLERKSLFMFFFCLRSTLEWVWQHDSFFFLHNYLYEIGFTSGTIRNDWTFQNVLFLFVKCLTWTSCSSSICISVYLSAFFLIESTSRIHYGPVIFIDVRGTTQKCFIYPGKMFGLSYVPQFCLGFGLGWKTRLLRNTVIQYAPKLLQPFVTGYL